MLKPIKQYEAQLNDKLSSTTLDKHYAWYHMGYPKTSVQDAGDFFNYIRFVSVNNDEVIGYFGASWARPENFISNISCINFNLNKPHVFAVDFLSFMKYLIKELNVPKINFSVTIGNPAEKHYDRLIRKIGGRIVGTFKRNVLIANKYYDEKYYEWVNKFYTCTHCGERFIKKDYIVCSSCGIGELKVFYR